MKKILFPVIIIIFALFLFQSKHEGGHEMFMSNEEYVEGEIISERQEEMEYRETNGIKVFELTADRINWELTKGNSVSAYAYNKSIPGPTFRVTEGDQVQIYFTNNLEEPTTIHWHGIPVPNDMDGVEGLTQEAIQPGETFVYEFEASPAGTFMYHPHTHNSTKQLDMGLAGMFIIEEKGQSVYDKDYEILLDEWIVKKDAKNGADGGMHAGHDLSEYNFFTMNGKSHPDIPNIDVEEGDRVKVRLGNLGFQIHPMHLHGHFFSVTHKDGMKLPQPYQANTLSVLPGETYDIEFVADNSGDWMFHCHMLHHTANNGMEPGGLMQVVHYEGHESMETDPHATHKMSH